MSTKVTTNGTSEHIDAERLAAWADHGLPAAEATEVDLHLSHCERCQEVLAAFVRSEPAPAVVIPFWARRPVQWSAAGLAAAAALFLIVQTQLPKAPRPDSVVASAREESAAQSIQAPPSPAAEGKAAPASPDDLRKERQSRSNVERDAKADLANRADQQKGLRKVQPERTAVPTSMPRPAALPPPPPTVAPSAQATAPPTPTVGLSGAISVVAPPTPPPATPPPAVGVAGGIAGRASSGIPAMNESIVVDSARANVIEIVAPGPAALRRLAFADARGGGVGGAGRGGAAQSEFRQQGAPARWRILAGMRVELSLDAGASWNVLPIEPALTTPLVTGVAAGQSVCWLVGREGVVLLTTDGRTFRRVSLPEPVQLVSVTAEDNLRATVTAVDGRKFSTIDGGLTWK